MKKRIFLLGASSLLLAACGQKAPNYSAQISAQWIEPSYANLILQSENLQQQFTLACSDQSLSREELTQLQSGWKKAMASWQAAQWVHFGPIEQDNLRWQFQFWPDLHNNIRRKVQPLMAKEDALSLEQLKTAGVVARGFSALEYALFDQESAGQSNPGLCGYLTTAGLDLNNSAKGLHAGWEKDAEYRKHFDTPGEKNPVFPRALDTTSALLDSVVAQLEVIRIDKLAGPLGLKTAKSRPNAYLAESWRSETSLLWLAENLAVVERVLLEEKLGLLHQVPDAQLRTQLITEVDGQLSEIKKHLALVADKPFAQTLKDQPAQLIALHDAWQALLQNVKQNLPKALGVTLGFNANDGD